MQLEAEGPITSTYSLSSLEAIREGLFDNCRVGATHRFFRGIGGLHPPYEELPG